MAGATSSWRFCSPARRACQDAFSYIVATDPADPNAIWIHQGVDSKTSHDASLALLSVKDAIAKGRPLIAGFAPGTLTTPVGGHGLGLSPAKGH